MHLIPRLIDTNQTTMKSSFRKSLPSHRKRERERKLRASKGNDQQQTSSSLAAAAGVRTKSANDNATGAHGGCGGGDALEEDPMMSQESMVEATQLNSYSPRSPSGRRSRPTLDIAAACADQNDKAVNNNKQQQAAAIPPPSQSSHHSSSIISHQTTSKGQFPPSMIATRMTRSATKAASSQRGSSYYSTSPTRQQLHQQSPSKEYDEETIGMYSPLTGRAQVLLPGVMLDTTVTTRRGEEGTKTATTVGEDVGERHHVVDGTVVVEGVQSARGRKTGEVLAAVKSLDRMGGSEHNVQCETNVGLKTPRGNVEKDTVTTAASKKKSARDSKMESINVKSDESEESSNAKSAESLLSNPRQISAANPPQQLQLTITPSLIAECIEEINNAKSTDEDAFGGMDIEAFEYKLDTFRIYITALGDATSSEALDLNAITQKEEWAFVIFERGMGLDHCGALFVHDMMKYIGRTIDDVSGGGEVQHEGKNGDKSSNNSKLDQLSACIEMVFGIRYGEEEPEENPASTFVSIEKTKGATSLQFTKGPTAGIDGNPTAAPAQQQMILPSHLEKISRIFSCYFEQHTRPIQAQLDYTRKALAESRVGAMELQKSALNLQDELGRYEMQAEEAQERHEELETALRDQKKEHALREASFERTREFYKAEAAKKELELVQLREKYERELKEVREELTKARRGATARRDDVDVSSEHHTKTRGGSFSSNDHPNRRSESYQPVKKVHTRSRSSFDQLDDVPPSKKKTKSSVQAQTPLDGLSDAEDTTIVGTSVKKQRAMESRRASEPKSLEPAFDRSLNRFKRQDDRNHSNINIGRNPLGSLAVNSFVEHSSDVKSRSSDNDVSSVSVAHRGNSGKAATISTSTSPKAPSKAAHLPAARTVRTKRTENESCEYTFKYKEVVRGKDARRALPAHECEHCIKFNNAVEAQTGASVLNREQMLHECSRHRASHAPESTPPDYWEMSFADSIAARKY